MVKGNLFPFSFAALKKIKSMYNTVSAEFSLITKFKIPHIAESYWFEKYLNILWFRRKVTGYKGLLHKKDDSQFKRTYVPTFFTIAFFTKCS